MLTCHLCPKTPQIQLEKASFLPLSLYGLSFLSSPNSGHVGFVSGPSIFLGQDQQSVLGPLPGLLSDGLDFLLSGLPDHMCCSRIFQTSSSLSFSFIAHLLFFSEAVGFIFDGL